MRCAIALTKQHTITTSVLSWGFTSDPAHWLETEIERKKEKKGSNRRIEKNT
jgi:hypothetical protein